MKVAHVTQNYEPSRGGTQHTMKKVSEYLVKEFNDDVSVITTNSYYGPNRNEFKKIAIAEEYINGVYIKRFDFVRFHRPLIKYYTHAKTVLLNKPISGVLGKFNAGPISPSMTAAINNTEADIICASSVHYLFADYPLWRQKKRKPFVLYGALHLKENETIPPVYLKRIKHADYYIANTTFEKETLISYGIQEAKIKVIGAATDVFQYADKLEEEIVLKTKYKIEPQVKILLYIGRHEASKNLDCLIKAYHKVKEENVAACLVIAGAKGTYTSVLEGNSKADHSIILLKDIAEKQKCELLKIADVLVLPSEAESFGVVFLEAWSYKKAVIGAGIGAISSLIEDGREGLLFNPGDADDLALKIKMLLQNKDLSSKMGEKGYKKVMDNYTWPVIAGKFRDTYQLAIDSAKR